MYQHPNKWSTLKLSNNKANTRVRQLKGSTLVTLIHLIGSFFKYGKPLTWLTIRVQLTNQNS